MNSKQNSHFKIQSQEKQNQPLRASQDSKNISSNNIQPKFSRLIKKNSCNYPLTIHNQTELNEQCPNLVQSLIQKKLQNVVQLDWMPSRERNIRKTNQKEENQQYEEDRFSISSFQSYIDSSQVTKKKPRFSRSSLSSITDTGTKKNTETPNIRSSQFQQQTKTIQQLIIKNLEEQLKKMKTELYTKTIMVVQLSNDVQIQSNKIQELEELKNKEVSQKQNEISELEIELRVLRQEYLHIHNSLYALEDVLARYKDQNQRIKRNQSQLVFERKKLKQRVEKLCNLLSEQQNKRDYPSKKSDSFRSSGITSHSSIDKRNIVKNIPRIEASKFTNQLEISFQSGHQHSSVKRKPITKLSSSLLQISPD